MNLEPSHNDKVKILLVDDTPENLTALEAVLEDLGQEQMLVKAYSGAEALRRILMEDFAVILLDVRMPGMDGLEVATLVRQRERSRNTPIIFVTAYKDDEKLIRGYDLGAVDYLVKPIEPDVLKSKVGAFIELARKTQALKSHAELLESKNRELEAAMAQRREAEEEVRVLNQRLEGRLAELRVVNRELEELYRKVKELDETKTRFFANVSHDMRTPLALMLGPAEKLLESELTEDQRRSIETLERHTRSLLNHVNDLLDISKLDAGKMGLNYANVDLMQIVQLTAANFESLAKEREISFAVDTPEDVPAQTDPEKLGRVLLNLLSNAFRHAPDGGKVECQLRSEAGRALITVADNGPGIPADFREAVFERFRQGAPGGQRTGSAGLGLSIVKEFVTLLGGSVSVAEVPEGEGGALFTIDLPLTAPAGAQIGSAAPESGDSGAIAQALAELRSSREGDAEADRKRGAIEAAATAREKPMLLVIEDNPAMSRFITAAVAGDFQVENASDGKEGLEKALVIRPDLILTDVMLPTMRGDELVRQVRARPELEAIPLVVLTGLADEALRTRLLREGAQDYLTKPFSVAELRQRVRNLVAMKRARELLQNELASRSQNLEKLAAEVALRKREAEAAHAEANAANRAKDHFLATVSHELRTPLTAVLGWVRLLQTGSVDESAMARALETIERNAKIQAQLIDEILDVSRIITGKLRLDSHPIDLRRVIEAAIDAIRPAAEAQGVRLEAELGARAAPAAGDAARLQQVVWNLLSNAVKFTPKGGHVAIRLARGDSRAEITVSDTGRGISPDFLPHIFERFSQADDVSSKPSQGGLGLGLAIVKHLVELHGGEVQARSHGEGQGATFTIVLPLLADVPEAAADGNSQVRSQAPAPLEEKRLLDGLHVLVVDDEADTREILSRVLEHRGAHVTAVSSAAEGIGVLAQEVPDVILSDIQMPHEDGYTLIRRVREMEGERGWLIPAAAVTAHASAEDRMQALSAGFQMHVPKPVEPAELVAVVANLAGRTPH